MITQLIWIAWTSQSVAWKRLLNLITRSLIPMMFQGHGGPSSRPPRALSQVGHLLTWFNLNPSMDVILYRGDMSPYTADGSRVNADYEWIAWWIRDQLGTFATHSCVQHADHLAMTHPSKNGLAPAKWPRTLINNELIRARKLPLGCLHLDK